MNFYDTIISLVKNGVNVDITLDADNEVIYDVNTRTKSHMYLLPKEGSKIQILMRYGKTETIDLDDFETEESILYYLTRIVVFECMYGRAYIGAGWANLASKLGINIPKETHL